MGNCLTGQSADDLSLLHNDSDVEHDRLGPPPPYQEQAPVYHPTPGQRRTVSQLTEEEQVKIAKRMGLIQHLPTGKYDASKKVRECVICMIDFQVGDPVRFLPCMHTYHVTCIDDWLMRSFTCPSCMEPVDAALLMSYDDSVNN
ncbi:RING finger protein 11-like [Anneissia japonica]|uniref:RING finger protein 11-like n=1 Tax=Anneissia japonica TaxID=1529436 RepID=UPI001425B3EA|nr:RING finger protein 11-like [Anneissia japonica]